MMFSLMIPTLIAAIATGPHPTADDTGPPEGTIAKAVPLDEYVAPSGTVTLDSGEPMQVTCLGEGGPTAVLLAGSGGWSNRWAPIHAEMATITRTCSIDRPGWGMSGVGRGLSSPDMVEDYRAAMAAAGETGPFILVGHSLGGEEAVFWADRHGEEIAGMVLVDPGMPELAARMAEHAPLAYSEMKAAVGGAVGYFNMCAERIEANTGGGGEVDLSPCRPRVQDEAISEALASVAMDPARFRYNAAAMAYVTQIDADTGSYSGELGDIFMTILQATTRKAPPYLSAEAKAQSQKMDGVFSRHHDRLTTFSNRAELRPVEDASHDILVDRPDAVIAAFREMVIQLRGSARD